MKVRFLVPAGGRAVSVDLPTSSAPATLRDAALLAGTPIAGTCGGKGTCGKCRVQTQGDLSPVTPAETRFLSPGDLAAGYRLACQARPLGDVLASLVAVPSAPAILTGGRPVRIAVAPSVRRLALAVPGPSGTLSDEERVRRALAAAGHPRSRFSLHALRLLPDRLHQALRLARETPEPAGQPGVSGAPSVRLLVTLAGDEIVDVEASSLAPRPVPTGDPPLYGMAFDIGTTTVVGYLLDLATGRQAAVVSCLNPQAAFGADVISRLTLALTDPQGLTRLREAIRLTLNDLITQATAAMGIDRERIYEVTVAGNTAMHHMFLGISPVGLAYAPYSPAVTAPLDLAAADVGLRIAPAGRAYVLPNIAGYVGADTAAVIVATGLDRAKRLKLAIDIGTNGEIVLGSRHRLVCCSTAAGPAFEGARISRGMIASQGAADRVDLAAGDIRLHVIDGGPAVGICGSGLVDLVAILLQAGLVMPSGRFASPRSLPSQIPPALAARLVPGDRGMEFVLHAPAGPQASTASTPSRLTVTQHDLRELQLAKGAMRAGMEVLLRELGVSAEDVTEVYLAGAFGNYVRPASAQAIGLLPHFPNARLTPVGNAAGTGARMALVSTAARRRLARLPARVDYVELAARADFQDIFMQALGFPSGG
jgi:uncharacterized 2Fe-2S/4Fe-4S cluster protein (DUF4445 family)